MVACRLADGKVFRLEVVGVFRMESVNLLEKLMRNLQESR